MIDERYHIYSIAAVFFALAVGIIIGTSMARSPGSEREQTTIRQYERWMGDLRREIESQTRENSMLATAAQKNEEFCQVALPVIAKNRLAWRNVAIIRTGDYDDLTGAVKRALELAGAQVTSVTQISRNFPFNDEDKIRRVLSNCGIRLSIEAQRPSEKLWGTIASIIADPQGENHLSNLEEAGVAKFTGTYNKPIKLIVLVGGASSKDTDTAEMVDSRLIARWTSPEITVVGCESTKTDSSFLPEWQKMGIATVDNADTGIGQVALICALNGERASFGVRDTADRMIPQRLEQQ